MRINWFKDENNLVYINGATQLAELERTLHFPGWRRPPTSCGSIPHRRASPSRGMAAPAASVRAGSGLRGAYPDGENIFFFMGEMQECYVIYWLDAPVVAE